MVTPHRLIYPSRVVNQPTSEKILTSGLSQPTISPYETYQRRRIHLQTMLITALYLVNLMCVHINTPVQKHGTTELLENIVLPGNCNHNIAMYGAIVAFAVPNCFKWSVFCVLPTTTEQECTNALHLLSSLVDLSSSEACI